ncbi:aldehyde dehydrogenase family protein [Dactylosporangium aurantiacum]|uniref:Aldehyde dehydrogenase family protein n=1 Tax=Dactylosporangium aurantiacum TaxID=35754 RepID=A0A9Q9IER8_9ACTN|nr:aldehyde dehydrogenase family protein [Dactylosporangium aurantiacum]MDG6103643.1 aldehyde dehydrogenase family protein [Dactylosporangium aurantiacum]UWZ51868.1 aldehyde dehydrogenase family protein [Dactylosporangium aurantiacum]
MTVVRENPARTGEVVGRVVAVTRNIPDRVDDAVRAAHAAFRRWSATPLPDRLAALRAAADAVAGDLEGLAVLLAREIGKPLPDCRGEIGFAVQHLRWVIEHAPAAYADRELDDAAGRLLRLRKPYGVVVAVTPWNAPVILTMLKLAPALAAGNTVLVKPSPLGPLTVERVVRLLQQHLPSAAVKVLHGHADLVTALVTHRLVRKVAFTGGEDAGRAIAAAAADRLIPSVLELGGNDPAVFLDDAPLDDASMDRLVMASFASAGQVCMAAKRLYVPRARAGEFVEAYVAAAQRVLVVGDPLAAGVTMGPMISDAARRRARDLTLAAGAELVDLGRRDAGYDETAGYFLPPVLVVDPPQDAAVLREEQFAPVVPVTFYDAEDQALAMANDDDLGLGASVWSADEDRAFAFARRLEAGFAFVNTHNRTGMSLRAPFGGVKRSGWGREYAQEGLAEYAQTCVVHAPAAFRAGGAGLPPTAYPS